MQTRLTIFLPLPPTTTPSGKKFPQVLILEDDITGLQWKTSPWDHGEAFGANICFIKFQIVFVLYFTNTISLYYTSLPALPSHLIRHHQIWFHIHIMHVLLMICIWTYHFGWLPWCCQLYAAKKNNEWKRLFLRRQCSCSLQLQTLEESGNPCFVSSAWNNLLMSWKSSVVFDWLENSPLIYWNSHSGQMRFPSVIIEPWSTVVSWNIDVLWEMDRCAVGNHLMSVS